MNKKFQRFDSRFLRHILVAQQRLELRHARNNMIPVRVVALLVVAFRVQRDIDVVPRRCPEPRTFYLIRPTRNLGIGNIHIVPEQLADLRLHSWFEMSLGNERNDLMTFPAPRQRNARANRYQQQKNHK